MVNYWKVQGILFLSIFIHLSLLGNEKGNPTPLLCLGGGYLDAGSHHSGGLAQIEYKFGKYFWHYIRPQASLIVPELRSVFVGVGLAFEIYSTDRLIFSPSFTPGLYYRGKGKDLGFPIEFRSSLEVAYEFANNIRIGSQFYHISNASLSHKNPGVNALTVFLAIPLCRFWNINHLDFNRL